MTIQLSGKNRSNILTEMANENYDLFIIGGGITGAGIAFDAVTRGMKVALVEMQDFAAGTSSRSTKLVHGGLRYLKQFEIGIVKETGRERAIVYENGPHVTTPEWMLLPFHSGGTFGPFTTSIGLKVYDFLAQVKKSERRSMLSAEETLKKEPLVKKQGLKGGGYYVEYKTDDARLTIEVLKGAVEKGATAINYTKAEKFIYNDAKKIVGVVIRDMLTGETYEVKATKFVNAAGPWVDDVRSLDYAKNNKQLRLTKGIHLVFDQSVFPLKQAVYFDTPDGRMVFAIPREGKTYVGTTDTFFDQDKTSPKMNAADRDYIIEAIHFMFPDVKVTKDDVESSWAGVRPLIYEEGKDPSEISRKDEIWTGESGLITIAGGKLTGYRKMAEDVVNLVSKQLQEKTGRTFKPGQTLHLPISGGEIGGSSNLEKFVELKAEEAKQYGLTKEEGKQLARKYGSNVNQLFQYAQECQASEAETLPPMVYAQFMYALDNEMIVKPTDFFIRRTGALFFAIDWVRQWKTPIIEKMAVILEWKEEEKNKYIEELDQAILDATVPVDEQK
ncbi:glycerol-3-phosphate dehydrogenase/oxidase [Caldibacillus lycopersici]|uniref:Glycerol-3-phosphate dehydrogenase n=1 Tax=Perspicuibacillus lycopersici TaxID=1325689 RepID=A0AAE3LSG3_9BACI|nr:glycerol-3-phosphate dehydrogenase/oxidase [Perspicuibacillus lycopersici]MCU9612703.1 glycerol-3-phosphate dehydrogenase/oxidase [Perspicuibacillus lycopersici]